VGGERGDIGPSPDVPVERRENAAKFFARTLRGESIEYAMCTM
jgi:hypothetical protein